MAHTTIYRCLIPLTQQGKGYPRDWQGDSRKGWEPEIAPPCSSPDGMRHDKKFKRVKKYFFSAE